MEEKKMDVSYTIGGALDVTVDGTSKNICFKSFVMGSIENQITDTIYEYSPNQRKTIIAKTEKLIDAYDTGDCPTMLRLLLAKLKEVG